MMQAGSLPIVRRGGKSPRTYVVIDATPPHQKTVAYSRNDALRLLNRLPDGSQVYLSQRGEMLPGLWQTKNGVVVKVGTDIPPARKRSFRAPKRVQLPDRETRINPELVTFGNPPRRRNGADSSVRSPTRTSTEVRSPTRTSTRARTEGNVTVTGGAGRGATTSVTIRKNPRRVATALLSKRALALEYAHVDTPRGAVPYRHEFKHGVCIQLLTDGSLRLYSSTGKPLFKWFETDA